MHRCDILAKIPRCAAGKVCPESISQRSTGATCRKVPEQRVATNFGAGIVAVPSPSALQKKIRLPNMATPAVSQSLRPRVEKKKVGFFCASDDASSTPGATDPPGFSFTRPAAAAEHRRRGRGRTRGDVIMMATTFGSTTTAATAYMYVFEESEDYRL